MTHPGIALQLSPHTRVFKAAKFAREASRRRIADDELCRAVAQVQASPKIYSLGGEVYKKRLNDNLDRSILLAKGGTNWFYAHLFRKSDQANITKDELAQFRAAARELAALSDDALVQAVRGGALLEICNER